jgi:predicted secreted hydrolase
MQVKWISWSLVAVSCIALAFVLVHRSARDLHEPKNEPELASVLQGEAAEGFARAETAREFRFPDDHGAHPAFRTEWWYFTGNLHTPSGRRFGYELALFRVGLSPEQVARTSQWATNQVYMGHLAITDVQSRMFRFDERLARNALDLAGAQQDPLRIWVEDWSIAVATGAKGLWQLHAGTDEMALALELTEVKPVVLQGEAGLSAKSGKPGNASYYYSIPRLDTRGTITVDGELFRVAGLSWMDREWSTSALGEDQVGWDWFSLQLSDGYDLMFYQLRRKDGDIDPHSMGALIDPDGRSFPLRAQDVFVEALDVWESPRGGVYPSHWRIKVEPGDIVLEITPVLDDQELDVSVRYWEGAVNVAGRHGDTEVSGKGYVELTGYDVPAH